MGLNLQTEAVQRRSQTSVELTGSKSNLAWRWHVVCEQGLELVHHAHLPAEFVFVHHVRMAERTSDRHPPNVDYLPIQLQRPDCLIGF